MRAAAPRWCARCGATPGSRRLAVFCRARRGRSGATAAIREIPLDAIGGHARAEPRRAVRRGLPAGRRAPRAALERIWLAEDRGAVLPPISVVAVGERFAVLDGHHRVSVARARGAVAIDAPVDAV